MSNFKMLQIKIFKFTSQIKIQKKISKIQIKIKLQENQINNTLIRKYKIKINNIL
jgi:hypothetical protein